MKTKKQKVLVKLKTDGCGHWSNCKKEVSILNIEIHGRELRVYFDTKDWDISKDGLIYTDELFLTMLRAYLKGNGKSYWDCDYSEQGMQRSDYVSLDI